MVEIDGEVIEVCRHYLAGISAGAFDDPRARIVLADGVHYLRQAEGPFDAIIVDSTDPTPSGPAQPLFSSDFYREARRLLGEGGVFVTQSGSPIFRMYELVMAYGNLREAFPRVRVYLAPVPSYPGGLWAFTLATAGPDVSTLDTPLIQRRLEARGIETLYYSPHVHGASFVLPPFLARALAEPGRFQSQELPYPVSYEARLHAS